MSDGTDIIVRDIQVPANVCQAMDQLDAIKLAIKRLKSYEDKYKKYLGSTIPVEKVDDKHEEGEVDGILRKRFISIRTAYQKVLVKVVDELVPRTKLGEVATITEEFTTASWSEKYSRAKEDGGDDW